MGRQVGLIQKLLYLLQCPLQFLGKLTGGCAQYAGAHGGDADKIVLLKDNNDLLNEMFKKYNL